MDAVRLLKRQHREVEGLFKQVARTADPRQRQRILADIKTKLETHAKIEEEFFYPAVRALETRTALQMIDEAYEEHHVVDLVLSEVPGIDAEGERFQAQITVLREMVEHHVHDEESKLFKLAEKLGREQLKALGVYMAAAAGL